MNEGRWAALLDRVRREYNPPPETPRDEMWARIEPAIEAMDGVARRDGSGLPPSRAEKRLRPGRGPLTVLLSIAALLLLWLGYGLGRATTQADPAETPGSAVATGTEETATPATGSTNAGRTVTAARTPEDAYGFAAVRLLASTGSLLTQVEDQVASGALRADAGTWARGLLTRTRLMLDSPSMVDDDLRALLEDLELILMQVVTVSGAQDGGHAEVGGFELRQLTNGLREGDVLPRIQRMLPPVIASDS